MKRKILFGILALMLFIQVIPVDAYSIIKEESGSGWSDLYQSGREYYQRTFYSNYTKHFYSIYSYHGPGWANTAIMYSYSPDGVTWARSGNQIYPLAVPGLGWTSDIVSDKIAFYMTPDGKHIYYCFEGRTDADALYWGKVSLNKTDSRLVNNVTADVILNGAYGGGPPQSTTWGTKEIDDKYSIVVDDLNYVYIGMEVEFGIADRSYMVIKSNAPDFFAFEDFGDSWLIEEEWILNGHANPENVEWNGIIFPLRDNGFIEDIGCVFSYDHNAGTQELHRSMYYDNSTDDWIDFTGSIFNDAEGGDWRDLQWDLGWSSDIAVLFKQDESEHTPERIDIDALFLNIPTRTWENRTEVTWDELGDGGTVNFLPLVSVREGTNAVNFAWSLSGNDTIWERRMFPNGTLEAIRIVETGLPLAIASDKIFNDPNANGPSPYSWFWNNGEIPEFMFLGDHIVFNYTFFLESDGDEEDWEPIYGHESSTLYNPDGSPIEDNWLFEGEVYDLVSVVNNLTSFQVQGYDTVHNFTFHWNNATEQTWIEVDPADQFTIGLPWSNFTRDGEQTTIRWRFILDRSIVDCVNQTWMFFMENSFYGPGMWGDPGIITHIYNLGGFTYYTLTGDGFRTPGGQPFEVYATNGTDGSFARAEQIYRKLQSVHFLVELDLSNEWDAGNGAFDMESAGAFDIGIDYRINGTWIQGWFVRLTIRSSNVGHHNGGNDHNWVEWNVDWYNYNATLEAWHLRRHGTVVTNHWGYDNENIDPDYHNRTSSQLWIDLWFDRTNSSTTVAGQVNAMYHGMKEHGSSWWFGYGAFMPMISEEGNSQYLDDLNVEGFNASSMDLDLMRVYVSIDKDPDADADDEPWGVRAIENLNRKQADDRMQGVEIPSFESTLVLDMPMFQSNNPLIRAIDGISRSIWLGALSFIKILWGAMDSIFEWAGFGPGFFSLLTSYMMEIPSLVIVIMDNLAVLMVSLVDIIESIAQVLVQILPAYVGSFGLLATSMIRYWNFFMDIFGGGMGLDFSILQDIAIQEWINFGLWMLPFWEIWSIIWAKDVTGRLKDRIEFYSMIGGGMLNFIKGIILLMSTLVQAIRSFLPI